MGDVLQWPRFPTVEVIGNRIVIFYEDGSKVDWGVEAIDDPYAVAYDIRDGLRVIRFFQESVDNILEVCLQMLIEAGFSKEMIKDHMDDAFKVPFTPKGTREKADNFDINLFYVK